MPGHSRGSGMPDRLVPVSRPCLQGMTKQARSRTGDQMRLPVTGPACQEKPCSPGMLLPRGPGPGTHELPAVQGARTRQGTSGTSGSLQAPSLFMPAACSSSSATICSRMSAGASPGRASRASRRRSSSSLMLPSGYALRSTSRALAQPRLA